MGNRHNTEEINRRRAIGVSILAEYNFEMGSRQFNAEYKKKLKENNLYVPKSSKIIAGDKSAIKEMVMDKYKRKVFWTTGKVKKPDPYLAYMLEGRKYRDSIRRVYIQTCNEECIFYKNYKGQVYPNTRFAFENNFDEIKMIREGNERRHLLHVFIIFDEYGNGYESEVEELFLDNGLDNILYTKTGSKCTEIVTELSNLDSLKESLSQRASASLCFPLPLGPTMQTIFGMRSVSCRLPVRMPTSDRKSG